MQPYKNHNLAYEKEITINTPHRMKNIALFEMYMRAHTHSRQQERLGKKYLYINVQRESLQSRDTYTPTSTNTLMYRSLQ